MPTMETAKDRQNEERVAKILSEIFECDVQTTDTSCRYDFIGFWGEGEEEIATFVGELKCRNVEPFRYPDIVLSKDKREDVEKAAKEYGLIPVFFVQFNDGSIWMTELGEDKDFGKLGVIYNSRKKLKKDTERGYHVHMDFFEKIYGK